MTGMIPLTSAERAWMASDIRTRLDCVARWRDLCAAQADAFADALAGLPNRTRRESLAAEVMPLLETMAWHQRHAARVLKSRRLPQDLMGRLLRPAWVDALPLGRILVIGPGNYPVFIAGSQALQALVAGNVVIVKPGLGGTAALELLRALWLRAGGPEEVFTVLGEDPAVVPAVLERGVAKVLLTGSARAGRAVLALLAPYGVPSVMELSGADAVVVLPEADVALAARCIALALTFNGGATCIAPRRILGTPATLARLEAALVPLLHSAGVCACPPGITTAVGAALQDGLHHGARQVCGGIAAGGIAPLVVADVPATASLATEEFFAPVTALIPVADMTAAVALVNGHACGLGAGVFGPVAAAQRIARQLDVGIVQINDLVAPTADPALPFGGVRVSGFGRTRGAEGLLELTSRRVRVAVRGGRWHLRPTGPGDEALLTAAIQARHRLSLGTRLRAAGRCVRQALGKQQT